MSLSWLATSALPDHCQPETVFLTQLSRLLGTCIPTPLALISTGLGGISMVAWLCAQLPQIYKNWRLGSTAGLSFFFLVEWCLGDVSNLLGALFTHQASWQVAIGAYYVFVDLCLVGQWLWYERLKHGHALFRLRKSDKDGDGGSPTSMEHVGSRALLGQAGSPVQEQSRGRQPARPQIIFRSPTFQQQYGSRAFEKAPPTSGSLSATPGGTFVRVGSSLPMPSPSPRTVLMIACLIAVVAGSPVQPPPTTILEHVEATPTPLERAGTVLAWISTFLYLASRLPQLIKNWRRQSTAGLSPHLFIAAFCGNCFYSAALLTNPNAWYDAGPYGSGGWAGPDGNDRDAWVLAALPFFLGAAGVLVLDASVGVQFLMYGEERKLVLVEVDSDGDGEQPPEWRWRRVSGWMRGWIPSIASAVGRDEEREDLMQREDQGGSYGTL